MSHRDTMPKRFLFLDFDGVVCDSVPECFISSHVAYHDLYLGRAVSSVPIRVKELFYEYRPFIRSGEDYLLLHRFIEEERPLRVQADFDEGLEATPPETMELFKKLFYKARESILKDDRDFWLSLNPLFPGMKGLLEGISGNPRVFILSTKRPEFISEILGHCGVDWPTERTLYPAPRTKREVIEEILGAEGGNSAVFVDDQLDHLSLAAENPAIRGYLASWGYVKREWLEQKAIEVISRERLFGLARDFV